MPVTVKVLYAIGKRKVFSIRRVGLREGVFTMDDLRARSSPGSRI